MLSSETWILLGTSVREFAKILELLSLLLGTSGGRIFRYHSLRTLSKLWLVPRREVVVSELGELQRAGAPMGGPRNWGWKSMVMNDGLDGHQSGCMGLPSHP